MEQKIPREIQKYIDQEYRKFAGPRTAMLAMYHHLAPELAAIREERDVYRKALERISNGLPAEGRRQSRQDMAFDHRETAIKALEQYS